MEDNAVVKNSDTHHLITASDVLCSLAFVIHKMLCVVTCDLATFVASL